MVPLLGALLDYDASPATYERYDRMTALELFQKCARACLWHGLIWTVAPSCCVPDPWSHFVGVH